MKAKLIKTKKGYALVSADKTQPIASSINPHDSIKLSKQNCEELFGVKQWDRTCFDCNKGFNFEQMISDHKGCPYCEGINYAGVLYEQPSEIEVEIEMEVAFQLKKRVGGITNMGKPKLDSSGCLVLRKL
jgi:hypothetical protein